MSIAVEPPALSHIEKTLADAYRKEIDQEENIWRSLPFFAATLALQLAALFQLVDRIPPLRTWGGRLAAGFLGLSALATLTALGFLAACIYPRKFQYLAPDPELLTYAHGLIEDEAVAKERQDTTEVSALITLKTALALQYAVGAQHNRRINKLRERLRSIAGLATILSVVLTVMLVGMTFVRYTQVPVQERHGNERTVVSPGPSRASDRGTERDERSSLDRALRHDGQPDYPDPGSPERPRQAERGSADAGGHEGLVDTPRGTGKR